MINIIAIILFIAILISKMRRKIVRNLQKLEFVLVWQPFFRQIHFEQIIFF